MNRFRLSVRILWKSPRGSWGLYFSSRGLVFAVYRVFPNSGNTKVKTFPSYVQRVHSYTINYNCTDRGQEITVLVFWQFFHSRLLLTYLDRPPSVNPPHA